jgi:hypothetical protein
VNQFWLFLLFIFSLIHILSYSYSLLFIFLLGGGDKTDILSSFGAKGIDEEYLEQAIVVGNKPQKIPVMSPSPVKKSVGGSKKIERIVRRKLIRYKLKLKH